MNLSITYESSPNIALIKYWGKYNEDYILPINDNIGLTLDSKDFNTKTKVCFSDQYTQDRLILNGKEHPKSERLQRVFKTIRQKAKKQKYEQMSQQEWEKHHFFIESQNSFPTASGMASSASGLACLAAALNGLFGKILSEVELSELARFGSGSASRSVYGGLVKWNGIDRQLLFSKQKATANTLQKLSKYCISYSIKQSSKLSYIKVMCLLATNKEKQTSSTKGMKVSFETSSLIKHRNQIASSRISETQAYLKEIQISRANKDKSSEYDSFNKFAQVVIKDSNQFHAICLDTYPPIFYLNQFSRQVIEIVDHFINANSPLKVAYTFDAGPHAFLFIHEDNISLVLEYLQETFHVDNSQLNENARQIKMYAQMDKEKKLGETAFKFPKYTKETLKPYALWTTKVGKGCREVSSK